jgi:DNA-binding CsgD family transcriptional regulator
MGEAGYHEHNPCKHWRDAGRDAFTWGEVQAWSRRAGEAHPKARAMWGEAAANGMRDGLTVTSPGSEGQVLVTRLITDQRQIRSVDRPLLESLAIVFATLRLRLHEQADDRPLNSVLTAREAECLRWASRGLTDYAIAEHLGVSAKTINFHIENARKKLGAPNRLAAYHRALELDALA